MQIVIDIPQGLKVDFENENWTALTCAEMKNALMHGTILPKGHGALKDVDKIGLTNFECFLCNGDYKEALKMLIEKIKNADTVIEADKEVE